jgi:hypothetical protein
LILVYIHAPLKKLLSDFATKCAEFCSYFSLVCSVVSNMNVGTVDLSDLMARMDDRIAKAREQAISRKDILEKVEKWKLAAKEEIWLYKYERVHFPLCHQRFVTFSSWFCSVHVLLPK